MASYGILLNRRPIPFTAQPSPRSAFDPALTHSLVLVGELTERQLAAIAGDKSEALKIVEAKTGLKLKKIKKSVYFAGLLFQFVMLNAIIADRVKEAAVAQRTKKENG